MSEGGLHAGPTIRNFRTAGSGGRPATAAVKDCLTSDLRRPVTRAEMERTAKALNGRKKEAGNA